LRIEVDQRHGGDQRGGCDQDVAAPAEQPFLARFGDPVRALYGDGGCGSIAASSAASKATTLSTGQTCRWTER
jgi:hypothetical protein